VAFFQQIVNKASSIPDLFLKVEEKNQTSFPQNKEKNTSLQLAPDAKPRFLACFLYVI